MLVWSCVAVLLPPSEAAVAIRLQSMLGSASRLSHLPSMITRHSKSTHPKCLVRRWQRSHVKRGLVGSSEPAAMPRATRSSPTKRRDQALLMHADEHEHWISRLHPPHPSSESSGETGDLLASLADCSVVETPPLQQHQVAALERALRYRPVNNAPLQDECEMRGAIAFCIRRGEPEEAEAVQSTQALHAPAHVLFSSACTVSTWKANGSRPFITQESHPNNLVSRPEYFAEKAWDIGRLSVDNDSRGLLVDQFSSGQTYILLARHCSFYLCLHCRRP